MKPANISKGKLSPRKRSTYQEMTQIKWTNQIQANNKITETIRRLDNIKIDHKRLGQNQVTAKNRIKILSQ